MQKTQSQKLCIGNTDYSVANDEMVTWIACGAWVIKDLFTRGLMQGFSPEGYKRLKLINTGFCRASSSKFHRQAFDYLMMSDDLADGLPQEDFNHLKDLYNTHLK
jgi:hypothetical protein